MNIRSEKGFILAIVIFFVILMAIASIAIYSIGFYTSREVNVLEMNSVKGYYASLAGLRYAYILLQDPANITGFNFSSTTPPTGESKTLIFNAGDAGLSSDLGLTGNDALTITATSLGDGTFDVRASFSS